MKLYIGKLENAQASKPSIIATSQSELINIIDKSPRNHSDDDDDDNDAVSFIYAAAIRMGAVNIVH